MLERRKLLGPMRQEHGHFGVSVAEGVGDTAKAHGMKTKQRVKRRKTEEVIVWDWTGFWWIEVVVVVVGVGWNKGREWDRAWALIEFRGKSGGYSKGLR